MLITVFRELPNAVASLVGNHIMAALAIGTVGGLAAWVTVIAAYQSHRRRLDERHNRDRRLPGSFPGDVNR